MSILIQEILIIILLITLLSLSCLSLYVNYRLRQAELLGNSLNASGVELLTALLEKRNLNITVRALIKYEQEGYYHNTIVMSWEHLYNPNLAAVMLLCWYLAIAELKYKRSIILACREILISITKLLIPVGIIMFIVGWVSYIYIIFISGLIILYLSLIFTFFIIICGLEIVARSRLLIETIDLEDAEINRLKRLTQLKNLASISVLYSFIVSGLIFLGLNIAKTNT